MYIHSIHIHSIATTGRAGISFHSNKSQISREIAPGGTGRYGNKQSFPLAIVYFTPMYFLDVKPCASSA